MKQWIEPAEVEVPEALQAAVGGHPLVARVLARRGFTTPAGAEAFLDPRHYRPASPYDLPGMEPTVERLSQAIRQGEAICVWGDFDVDGQTSTTTLVSTLQDLGAEVSFHIPVRESESHGVNLPELEKIIQTGAQVVLTCDTGIAAHQAAAHAQSQGVDFLISDHHDLPEDLPDALAIINPKLLPTGPEGKSHPLAMLPGVGVAYKLAEALYAEAGRPEEVEKHLDLAALGIVADIAVQTGDTRYLLQRGLEALRATQRTGLQVMMELAEVNPAHLTEEHIGYMLGPRLNALGRLADANVAVEFLTTQDTGRARLLATQLEGLNAQRQLLTSQVFQAAQAQIERDPSLLNYAALVLAHPHWPAGVIGIVASQLVEHYNKPVVLISAPPGETGRGSARSVEGCNITAAIASQADLLASFGGHPMAAGLAIDPEHIEAFRSGLSQAVEAMLGERQAVPKLEIDAYLDLAELSLELVEDVERLAPFGPGNPGLVLASKSLTLKNHRPVGRNGEHRQLVVEDEQGASREVIWWNGSGWPLPEGTFDLAFTARASDYLGQRQVQVEWVEARSVEAAASAIPQRAVIEVIDYRGRPQPLTALKSLPQGADLEIWCEGEGRAKLAGLGFSCQDRYGLSPAESLVIWTTPPGPRELGAALEIVSPERVYLFGIDPHMDQMEGFLKQLAGLVKYTLREKKGQVRISALAASTAQRKATARKGLAWLQGRGFIQMLAEQNGEVLLAEGRQNKSHDLGEIAAQLEALLRETAAYRAHFGRADAEELVCPAE
jgi:single-stranded-DNA-specific exonuclease